MARRGENIYKRKDNRWEGRVRIPTDNRVSVYKSVYASSYLECKNKMRQLIREQKPVTLEAAFPIMRFSELSSKWLEHIRPSVKESTFAAYRYIIMRYLSFFLSYELKAVNKQLVQQHIIALLKNGRKNGQGGLGVRTVNNIIVVLKSVFKYAQMEYGIENPLRNIRQAKITKETELVLSSCGWNRLSKLAVDNQSETAAAIAISLYMGLRIGEVCALKAEDIDIEEKVLYVRRTVQRIRHWNDSNEKKTLLTVSEPKSRKSLRKIPIPDILAEKLRKLCEEKNGYLFGNSRNKPLEPRTLQYRLKSFLKEAKVEDIHFHTLRHTFATKCIEKEMDIKSLSEILGHAGVKITLEQYVHSSLEFKRKQINRLGIA